MVHLMGALVLTGWLIEAIVIGHSTEVEVIWLAGSVALNLPLNCLIRLIGVTYLHFEKHDDWLNFRSEDNDKDKEE